MRLLSLLEPKQRFQLSTKQAVIIVFTPFACGYFISYFYRTINAIVAPYLRDDIAFDASDLGLLSSVYFLTFAMCQIPLGILLDRYGPRRVQGILYCIAALGAALFALGDSVSSLLFSRALIGVGVSGGLMAALKAIVQWFPRNQIPTVNGFYFASGALGAIAATLPADYAIQVIGWRQLFDLLAIVNLLVAAFIIFTVPEKAGLTEKSDLRGLTLGLGLIFRDKYFWRIVPLMFTCASAHMAIQGLWAGLWLLDVEGLPREIVAEHLLIAAVTMAIGVTLSGPFATLCLKLGINIGRACCVASALYTFILLLMVIRIDANSYVLWGFIGLLGMLNMLVFAALGQYFPEQYVGRAHTAANLLVFAMSFAYQYGIGTIIEIWPPSPNGVYPSIAYVSAFLITIATQILAILWFIWPQNKLN